MAREQAPAFQFYPKDLLSDAPCVAMSCAEFGAYMRLLMFCWVEQVLPPDDASLAKLAGATPAEWRRVRRAVLERFTESSDGYRHGRLDRIRSEQESFAAAASEHGRRGARARWAHGVRRKTGTPQAMPEQDPSNARAMPSDGSASASPSAVRTPLSPPSKPAETPFEQDDPEGPVSAAEADAAWLLDHYPRWVAEERHGARYPVRPAFDGPVAFRLVQAWPERDHLEAMARMYLRSVKLGAFHNARNLQGFEREAPGLDAELRRERAS